LTKDVQDSYPETYTTLVKERLKMEKFHVHELDDIFKMSVFFHLIYIFNPIPESPSRIICATNWFQNVYENAKELE